MRNNVFWLWCLKFSLSATLENIRADVNKSRFKKDLTVSCTYWTTQVIFQGGKFENLSICRKQRISVLLTSYHIVLVSVSWALNHMCYAFLPCGKAQRHWNSSWFSGILTVETKHSNSNARGLMMISLSQGQLCQLGWLICVSLLCNWAKNLKNIFL